MVADLTFKIISQSMKGTSCNRNDFLSKMPVIYFVKDDRFSTGNWLNLRNLEEPSCAESFVNTSISKLLNSPSQFPFQTLFATLRKQQYLHRTTDLPWSSTSAIASVDLDLDSGDLSGVSGWAPRATSAQVPLVKSKSTSAAPRWTWPWLGGLERSPPSPHPPTVGLMISTPTASKPPAPK